MKHLIASTKQTQIPNDQILKDSSFRSFSIGLWLGFSVSCLIIQPLVLFFLRSGHSLQHIIDQATDAWKRLLGKLVTVQADYLLAQVAAGAQALQVFDSWAGRALGREDYLRYVAPHNRDLYAKVAAAGVPVINFSLGVSAYLPEAAGCGGDVVGLDWSLPLDEAWERVGFDRPVQGNLDPAALLAPWRELRFRIDDVLERAAGRPGHIFNVGHGLTPLTPVDNVRRLVEHVRKRTSA